MLLCLLTKVHFSSASLPLYSWMLKGWDAERVIRPSSKRYNAIAAQWNKELYFVIKSDSTNETFSKKIFGNIANFDKEIFRKIQELW